MRFEYFVKAYQLVLDEPAEPWLRKQFVLEAGCAMGHVMRELVEHGVECEGYEPSQYANENALEDMKPRIWQGDHNSVLPEIGDGDYDIVYANSLQYSHDEDEIAKWVREISRICTHSLFFCAVTTQGMYRAVSGPDIWKMQIIKPQQWWTNIFKENGFSDVKWINNVWAISLKHGLGRPNV